jgi:diguanylate cyclase (GGDEF)-like protein
VTLLRISSHVVLDALPDGVLVFDDGLRCVYANQRWREIAAGAAAAGEPYGEDDWTHPVYVGERKAVLAGCREALATGNETVAEFRIRLREGGTQWLLARFAPHAPDPDGRTGVIATISDITAFKDREKRLTHASERDPLTDALNRRPFLRELERYVGGAERYGWYGTLVLFDLDGLKEINDQRGHAEGDRLLRDFAGVLRGRTRVSDLAARVSGDEFAVLLPETSVGGAETVARAILDEFRATSNEGPRTASVGIARVIAGMSVEETWHAADAAMYAAKDSGLGAIGRSRPGTKPSDVFRHLHRPD